MTPVYTADYVAVTLEHTGSTATAYTISYEDLPPYLEPLPYSIDSTKGQKQSITFAIDERALERTAQRYNNGSIIGLSNTFIISLTEEHSGAVFNFPTTIEFKDYTWYQKLFSAVHTKASQLFAILISLPLCILILLFLAVLTILFICIGCLQILIQKRLFRLRKTLLLILGLVWLLFCIFTLISYGLPTSQELYTQHVLEENINTYMQLVEDTPKIINMSTLFNDPDNDISLYGVYAIDKGLFSYTVDGSYLRLVPHTDWYGSSYMRLFATDSFNETAISQNIVLEVLPVEDYTFIQLVFAFCDYLLVLGSALCLLVFVCLLSLRPRSKEKQKRLTEIK